MHQYLSTTQAMLTSTTDLWLNVKDFSILAGIAERRGSRALSRGAEGLLWNGCSLKVRKIEGCQGRGGKRFEVFAPSLPDQLYAKWLAVKVRKPMPDAPVARTVQLDLSTLKHDPLMPKRSDEALWRLSIIQPILPHKRQSQERKAAIDEVLQRKYFHPDGKNKKISQSSLYQWLSLYDERGIEGLVPVKRSDKGKSRTIIGRQWDSACPLDELTKKAIGEQIQTYVRSLWRSGATGWRVIQQLSSTKLIELSQAAGWNADKALLRKACHISRQFIENERDYKIIAIQEQDAKQFFDEYQPRIRRTTANMLPMELVVGDVHPIDIAVKRQDGSIAYPRAIAWQDVANNRLFFTLVLLCKGEGIKQVDIAHSFASMCDVWGLPSTLYLDNGSEYSWHEMMQGFAELSRLSRIQIRSPNESPELQALLAEHGREVVRALPYNAPAKPIEGLFSVMESRVFAMIPGWVGGNRMKKKTHNVGREPLPFPGTWQDFQNAMEEALTFYHQTPQAGNLNGLSPQQAYEAALAKGWGKVGVSEEVLLVAFATEDQRYIRAGYILWDGTEYYDDALLPYTGQQLTVRVARHNPHFAFVFNNGEFICAAQPAPVYGFLETSGAKEQARRHKSLKRTITERKGHTNRLDMVNEMTRHNGHHHPMPQAPISTQVTLSSEAQAMLDAVKAAEENQQVVTESEKATRVPVRQLSQWSSSDEYDPYLASVEFIDEQVGSYTNDVSNNV